MPTRAPPDVRRAAGADRDARGHGGGRVGGQPRSRDPEGRHGLGGASIYKVRGGKIVDDWYVAEQKQTGKL